MEVHERLQALEKQHEENKKRIVWLEEEIGRLRGEFEEVRATAGRITEPLPATRKGRGMRTVGITDEGKGVDR